MQRPEHDHGHHSRQEEHDHQGVEDAEPLDVGVWHRVQDVVPARRPAVVTNGFLSVWNEKNDGELIYVHTKKGERVGGVEI